MTVARPVSWGILGVANIAVHKVIPAMTASEAVTVDAIASRSADKAAAAAASLGIPRSYGSYEELLADDAIEAVYIPLPNHLHHEWTIAAAEAGKHVLCEKPLALTAAEAQEMIDACDSAGVKMMEAFMYRLHPMWVEIRAIVERGGIGEMTSILTTFSFYNDDPSDIRNTPEAGGGAMYDIGCYQVNVSRMLFGAEPTRILASVHRDDRFGTDVLSSAILEFGENRSVLTCSTLAEPSQRVDIIGTNGRIVVEIPFNIPSAIDSRVLIYTGQGAPEDPPATVLTFPAADQYRIQAELFSDAISRDANVPTPPADAVGNLAVIEEILRN